MLCWVLFAEAAIEVSFLGSSNLRDVKTVLVAPLEAGHEVRIGTFDESFNPSRSSTPGELNAAWRAFGQTVIRRIDREDGRFGAEASSDDDAFKGKPIWLWILSTEDGDAVAGDYGNVTAQGLFRAEDWNFPTSDFPGANRMTITTDDVTDAIIGTLSPDSLILASLPNTEGFPGYAVWAVDQIGGTNLAASDDLDGDGIANGLEYFFDTSPSVPGSPPFSISMDGGDAEIAFELPDDGRKPHLIIETTEDLGKPFAPATVDVFERRTAEGLLRVTVQWGLDSPTRFFRLRPILR